ncbi:MAG: peptidase S13 [Ignavibacteriales bacterium]
MNFFILFLLISFLANAAVTPGPLTTEKIDEILAKLPRGTKFSVLAINPLTGDTIYQKNPVEILIPASNTKLYTTFTAIQKLGKDYRMKTSLFSPDRTLEDGVIDGNLYLKGFGNPLLTSEDLSSMAEELRSMGIMSINGDIVGDDSYFDKAYSREDWIEDEANLAPLAPVSALVVDRNKKQVVKVRRKRKRITYINVADPALNAAEILYKALKEKGIYVGGRPAKGSTPEGSHELAYRSVPLQEVISIVNKRSDNFLAECLFKVVGAAESGTEGSGFHASKAVKKFLDQNDIYDEGTEIVDGSGLSRFNLTSAAALTSLLEWAYFHPNYFDNIYNSLSIAGVDGTLTGRMKKGSAMHNFRGKTGTLRGTSAVSGYLKTISGDDLIVSIIFFYHAKGQSYWKSVEDRIIGLLASEFIEYEDEI